MKFTGEVPKHVRDSQLLNIETQKVVLGTPEIFKEGELNNTVLSMIGKNQIDRIVFDEVHTIITWGNSFRPIYRDVCEQFAKTSCPKLLLSATIPIRIETELKNFFVIWMSSDHLFSAKIFSWKSKSAQANLMIH